MSAYGVPVTDQTLKRLSRYRGKPITQRDRAREAMKMIQADGKNILALQKVLDLKKDYGNGASTLCLFYNATGDKLEIAERINWAGHVYEEEPPRSFENGQWLAFIHVRPGFFDFEPYASHAARVYRGKNVRGDVRDYMVAWCTPDDGRRRAYTEVREKDYFPKYWDYIKENLLKNASRVTRDESDLYCASAVTMGGASTSELIAIFSHK